LEALKMVWMSMGGDDQLDSVFVDSIGLQVKEKLIDKADMTWIDEGGDLGSDQVAIAVIDRSILPGVGIDAIG